MLCKWYVTRLTSSLTQLSAPLRLVHLPSLILGASSALSLAELVEPACHSDPGWVVPLGGLTANLRFLDPEQLRVAVEATGAVEVIAVIVVRGWVVVREQGLQACSSVRAVVQDWWSASK